MAFTLQILRGSDTYTISSPFSLEGAEGMGGASVRNIEESGPYQDGATHLDERLDPRTITLKLNVVGASASALDGHRDTLMTIFKPVRGVAITLKVTRDDGSVRQIDTRRTGPMDIPLVAINRPGSLHRAVVQLRAADPVWYDPAELTTTVLAYWWLASNTISAANVLEHVTSVGTAQAWALSGTVAAGSAWTVIARTSPPSVDSRTMWGAGSAETHSLSTTDGRAALRELGALDYTFNAGTAVYFFSSDANLEEVYAGTTLLSSNAGAGTTYALPTGGRWRSDTAGVNVWDAAMTHAAVYNIALSGSQRAALNTAILDNFSGTADFIRAIAYTGDFDSYPVITITGYVADPVITNDATGDTLDFTGGTVGSADVWTIDTRYGRKSVLNAAGSSVLQYLSSDSDLTTFRLVPSPLATGGTNTISVAGSVSGTAPAISIAYFTRYLSF